VQRRVICQGGSGDGHRSWPESPSDGGGDPVARELEGQRGERVRGRAGSVDPDPSRAAKPSPGGLAGPVGQVGRLGQQARWARWLAGQVGQMGFCQLIQIQKHSNLNSTTNSFMNSKQIQRFKYL
jgi:hypothetical protein